MASKKTQQALVDNYLAFYGVAMAMLHDDDDARDVVQEALTRTLTRVYVKNPVAYCGRAVRNLSISVLRRRKKLTVIEDLELLRDQKSDMQLEVAVKALEELPETVRALVSLHDMEDYSYAELALLTGRSESDMRRVVKGAHQLLKQKIMEADEE